VPPYEESVYVGRASLPFGRERIEGASTLLVTFPRMRAGSTRPSFGLRRQLAGMCAHRLYVGADEHKYVGPERRLDGLATAVELLGREADSIGVPKERIVCLGTSMAGVAALMVGLSYGAGRIVVGATPLRCGTQLDRFTRRRRWGGKRQAENIVEYARSPDGGDPIEFLDGLIFGLAAKCPSPSRIDILTSPHDYAAPSAYELADLARGIPMVEVAVHESEYERHGAIGDAFFPFLRRLLSEAPPLVAAQPAD
jgi:hypothetical protein